MMLAIFATVIALGAGDVHLPEKTAPETPCVLLIHGGGWSAMDRHAMDGVADYLCRDLGCVVYNVDYRLASKTTPWPACGEDCVAAANFMFTDAFAKPCGVRAHQIWIIGGSAGGHLALWTGLSLPSDKVAGIVSISGIGDPVPDCEQTPSRYRTLFGGDGPTHERLDSANPIRLIRPNGPKVLCTHATGDSVVPIASARNFERAYRAAGNEIDFHEYPSTYQPGLTGHCIWRPGSKPHRLIPMLERRIAYFMRPSAIPEPRPVKSKIEITALYYPGTEHMPEWDMVKQTLPGVKPLLGWYDEGYPENIDWQIKWAVEHGISSFCVDWYWNRGVQRLDHWVKGFYEAKFRKYLKWYVMWANHDQPGSHTTEGWIAVTKWWIDHYFKTPEYYKVNGKPAVVVWSRFNVDNDFIAEAAKHGETLKPGEGCRRAFDLSDRLVREAGLPGIYWINMNNEITDSPEVHETIRRSGFIAQMTYHLGGASHYKLFPELRTAEDTDSRTSFDLMAASAKKMWALADVDPQMPFWPTLPTGWNDLPRSFQHAHVTYGRTPEKFRRVCADAKAFCEKRGLGRIVISPLNEWQEGSYIEPNAEYGFAMYDALRDVFCEKPVDGWPENLTPKDLGLSLNEFPPMYHSPVQTWTFDLSPEGWYRQPYGCPVALCTDGALSFVTTRADNYNVRQRPIPFASEKYKTFRLRMKLLPNAQSGIDKLNRVTMRLKWGGPAAPVIGKDFSVSSDRQVAVADVVADGEWHEYAIDLSENPDWKGVVDELWFEAVNALHVRVYVDWMRFE